LIEKGKNYGWPLIGEWPGYNGVPIPNCDTRPDLAAPMLFWAQVSAPGNLMFYHGTFFRHSGQRSVSGDWQQHSPCTA
jgi:glucose/arabinose dehydrogenase